MKNGISIIICCYNSESKLPETLRHLAAQKYKDFIIELLVIDNNSKDDTAGVAISYWNDHGASSILLTVIKEPRPGLSFARDTGVRHAKCNLILFCDDDNWLNDDYCQQAYNIMSENEEIGILGGLNIAVGEIKLPYWFKQFEQSYACGPQNDFDGEVSRLYITGAGMIIKSELFKLFEQISFKSQLTDRKGEELSSGGDSEICFVAILLGYKLFYSSKLELRHFMESKRLNWPYFINMSLGHAKSSYKLGYYFNDSHKKKWACELFRIVKPVLGKRILVLIRDFFYANRGIVSSEKVQHMILFGQIMTHISMFKEYAGFVKEIRLLKVRVKDMNFDTANPIKA